MALLSVQDGTPLVEGLIVRRFKPAVDAAASSHHLRGPLDVLPAPGEVPLGGGMVGDVPDVGDFVRNADQLGAVGEERRHSDLPRLSLVLGELLVVGEFLDTIPDGWWILHLEGAGSDSGNLRNQRRFR